MVVAKRAWVWLDSPAARRVMTLLAVASMGLSVFVLAKQYQLTDCLAAYNDRSAQATGARTEAAERDRSAQDRMWQAFADAGDPAKVPPDQAQAYAKAAFERFLKDRAEANKQRAQNPLPAPPSQVCH